MKKILAFVLSGVIAVSACSGTYTVSNERGVPAPVSYTDWDRAIRLDVDMQTMYASSP